MFDQIQFIHSNNIIHLDMKPFNVIFANKEDDSDLRIIDFGISQELQPGQTSLPITMVGTLEVSLIVKFSTELIERDKTCSS